MIINVSGMKLLLIFLLFFILIPRIRSIDYYDAKRIVQDGKSFRLCREIPKKVKACLGKRRKGSRYCRMLPRITKGCQDLKDSWQLLAETCQKKIEASNLETYHKPSRSKKASKVRQTCRQSPKRLKSCLRRYGRRPKYCWKLPQLTKICQVLSEKWQHSAETCQENLKGDQVERINGKIIIV